jgi:hypothetical protein
MSNVFMIPSSFAYFIPITAASSPAYCRRFIWLGLYTENFWWNISWKLYLWPISTNQGCHFTSRSKWSSLFISSKKTDHSNACAITTSWNLFKQTSRNSVKAQFRIVAVGAKAAAYGCDIISQFTLTECVLSSQCQSEAAQNAFLLPTGRKKYNTYLKWEKL